MSKMISKFVFRIFFFATSAAGLLVAHGQAVSEPYLFTTFAGTAGVVGGADGTGSAAQFSSPSQIAVDPANNLYIADTGNHTIRKITPAGVVSTVAGLAGNSGSADGTGSAARFFSPIGIAIDQAGNLYVGDSDNDTIRKITPSGVVTTLAGLAGVVGSTDGTGNVARFSGPRGVTVDQLGNIYVADTFNNTIRKITPAGVVTTLAGLAGATGSTDGIGAVARFNRPRGVAADEDNNIFVADTANNTVRKITPAAVVSTVAGSAGIAGSVDGTGNVARLNGPIGITADATANLFVADAVNDEVRKITPAGVVTTLGGRPIIEGSADGAGSYARFSSPQGVGLDSTMHLFVSDTGNNTVRIGGSLSRPLNISTRARVETDQNVMIGGFIVTGEDAKTVIVRAIGPSLEQAGLSDVLADPVLELRGGDGSLIKSDDNWQDDPAQAALITAAQLAPQDDLESAIHATLDPGSYTAIVTGQGGTTGIGLVEVYDLDLGVGSHLGNISTRGSVQTGANVMIGGFILEGGISGAQVLVRAIGPTLAEGGVSGVLSDPTLELHNANGDLLSSNDDWKTDQQAEIEATALAPKADVESAILAILSPGSYTAIVAGKDGATGVGLVEVYALE